MNYKSICAATFLVVSTFLCNQSQSMDTVSPTISLRKAVWDSNSTKVEKLLEDLNPTEKYALLADNNRSGLDSAYKLGLLLIGYPFIVFDESILDIAVARGNIEILKTLLDKLDKELIYKLIVAERPFFLNNIDPVSSLRSAVEKNKIEMIKLLLDPLDKNSATSS